MRVRHTNGHRRERAPKGRAAALALASTFATAPAAVAVGAGAPELVAEDAAAQVVGLPLSLFVSTVARSVVVGVIAVVHKARHFYAELMPLQRQERPQRVRMILERHAHGRWRRHQWRLMVVKRRNALELLLVLPRRRYAEEHRQSRVLRQQRGARLLCPSPH